MFALGNTTTRIEFNSDLNPYLAGQLKPHFAARQENQEKKTFSLSTYVHPDSANTLGSFFLQIIQHSIKLLRLKLRIFQQNILNRIQAFGHLFHLTL